MVSREHLWITPRLRVGRPLVHPWQVVSQRDLHPAWALGCWGRVALLVVPDRRRHRSYLPGVSVVLLPMQSPKGFVGLRRTRAITRRWMQCASTREVCHRVNSYGFDVIVLLSFLRCTFNFLWLTGLLMDMQWPRLPLICIFSRYVFCLSRQYVSLNGHDRDHRLLSFFFHYHT